MKAKNIKKLSLNRQTVSNLDGFMGNIYGGTIYTDDVCVTYVTCASKCNCGGTTATLGCTRHYPCKSVDIVCDPV